MNPYLSQFGYQGPNILFVFIIIALYYYKHLTNPYIYLSVLIWQLLSHLLNVVIKNTLRLPRPDSSDNEADAAEFEKIKNSVTWKNYIIIHRNFGMPSGHAQAVVSELTFLALYFQKPWLTLAASCQAALTIYQRYKTRRHSLNQLILGSLLGFAVGFSFYKGVKMYNI